MNAHSCRKHRETLFCIAPDRIDTHLFLIKIMELFHILFFKLIFIGRSEMKSPSRVRLFATPWTVAHQAPPPVHGIFQVRLLEWVAVSFFREIFPTQGLNPGLLHCRQTLLPSEPPGKSFTRLCEFPLYRKVSTMFL